MPKSFIHKFHVSGMYNGADVAAVRSALRTMQAQITATRVIAPPTLRNAPGNTDFELPGLTTCAINPAPGIRDDEIKEPDISI